MSQSLEDRVKKLEAAIRHHRDQRQDDRCWLDDLELYAVLDDSEVPDLSLPPKDHFLKSCERFWEFRQCPDGRQWSKTPPPPNWLNLLRESSRFFDEIPATPDSRLGIFREELREAIRVAEEDQQVG